MIGDWGISCEIAQMNVIDLSTLWIISQLYFRQHLPDTNALIDLFASVSFQMMQDGVKTRLIPSLDGALYQFDGENVEALPFTADTLLSSSFKFTDDSTIVGGKEASTFGIDPATGKVHAVLMIKHVTLVAITGASLLIPCHTHSKIRHSWVTECRHRGIHCSLVLDR